MISTDHKLTDLFRQRGAECVVADVRDLRFDGEALYDKDGQRIDAIWRRCVTNDVIDHWDDSQSHCSTRRTTIAVRTSKK